MHVFTMFMYIIYMYLIATCAISASGYSLQTAALAKSLLPILSLAETGGIWAIRLTKHILSQKITIWRCSIYDNRSKPGLSTVGYAYIKDENILRRTEVDIDRHRKSYMYIVVSDQRMREVSLLVEGSGWLRRLVQLPVLPEPYLNCCIHMYIVCVCVCVCACVCT